MKLKQIAKHLKWTAVWTATWTMLMTPVAWGQQAKNVSKQEMQSMIAQMGLNRRITMGEFFERNKHLFSDRVLKEVEPFFLENRNLRMPQIEVVTVKSGLGENITTLRITDSNGQLNNVQWFGETKRMVKFQNTILTHNDIANFDDMFKHLLNQDPALRNQAVKSHNEAEAVSKFEAINIAFPSKKEWKSLSLENRAAYIVNFRRLLSQAREVNNLWLNKINEKNKPKSKKTSSVFQEKINFVKNLVSIQPAHASGDFTSCPVGDPCIIAGYTSAYADRNGRCSCDLPAIGQRFDNLDYKVYPVAERICREQIGSERAIACNPYLYMRANGNPICIDTRNREVIGNATTYEGLCDQQSQMSSEKIEVIETEIDEGRYNENNLRDDIESRARAAQGPNFEATKNFLKGTLTFIKNNRSEIDGASAEITNIDPETALDGPISEVVYNQLRVTHRTFQSEIGNARTACVGAARDGWHEPQFYSACDQLHARYIFIKDFLKTKCATGQDVNDDLKCTCPGGAEPVLPGATCGPPPPPVGDGNDDDNGRGGDDDNAGLNCPSQFPGADTVERGGQCVCESSGRAPTLRAEGARGGRSYTCGNAIDGQDDNRSRGRCEGRGLFCRLWQGIKTIFPYVVTGVVIYALFKMMAPKKPALTQPPDPCPDGSTAPCLRTCPNNPDQVYSDDINDCYCPNSCPTGSPDPRTCACNNSGGTGGTGNTSITLTCPDTLSSVSCPVGTPFTDCIQNGCTAYCERNGSPVYDPQICSSSQTPSVTAPPPSDGGSTPIDRGSGR